MGDDVDGCVGGYLGFDVRLQGEGAVGDGAAGGHAGGVDGAAGGGEGGGDAVPIVDFGEEGEEFELGEAEEAVGEDDGVFGSCWDAGLA